MNISIFDIRTHSREIIDFIVGTFTDTVQASSFKLCIIMTLPEVHQFIPGLMTMT